MWLLQKAQTKENTHVVQKETKQGNVANKTDRTERRDPNISAEYYEHILQHAQPKAKTVHK